MIIKRASFLFCFIVLALIKATAQCSSVITSFPYDEDFEFSDGGWVSGGSGSDWTWGSPVKSTISGAGGGDNCWIVGGLTPGAYNNSEASWLQSPCFDFSNLPYPYIEFKVFWETEQQFDGAALQYSVDNGITWLTIGAANYSDCHTKNWYNQDPVNFLSPLTSTRQGWSGNIQTSAGSCQGGGGSNGWVIASHVLRGLGNRSSVLFRFIFGAGSICNNYDGFAIDDIHIGPAPPNLASFDQSCVNSNTVDFTNTSSACPTIFNWDFGDPASGTANTATTANASHTFSGPGKYTVSLTVSSPGTPPSVATRDINIIGAEVIMLSPVDCQTNAGGSLTVDVEGADGIPLSYTWNTNPAQTGPVITGLAEGIYSVAISGPGICNLTATGKAEKDLSCIGLYFPSAFTPNGDGKNDGFGPLGSISSLKDYRLSIYNRWGERVFHSTDPVEKWDGKVKGIRTDGNVFVWMAEFSLPGREKESRKGIITLIR